MAQGSLFIPAAFDTPSAELISDLVPRKNRLSQYAQQSCGDYYYA